MVSPEIHAEALTVLPNVTESGEQACRVGPDPAGRVSLQEDTGLSGTGDAPVHRKGHMGT